MKTLTIHTDGGARGNPGPAGLGVVFSDDKKQTIATHKKYIGKATNNQAEYEAVILALKEIKKLNYQELNFYLDSKLVVQQLKGNYKVKNPELAKLFIKIFNLKQPYKKVTFTHIRREQNKKADALANQAMDEGV